jgi:uncharacterized protein
MTKQEILLEIRRVVLHIEPSAELILYGSVARGTATEESDWDFLILLDGEVDHKRTDRIRHALYEIEWDNGLVLSAIVRSRSAWNDPIHSASAFHHNVLRDGVVI